MGTGMTYNKENNNVFKICCTCINYKLHLLIFVLKITYPHCTSVVRNSCFINVNCMYVLYMYCRLVIIVFITILFMFLLSEY